MNNLILRADAEYHRFICSLFLFVNADHYHFYYYPTSLASQQSLQRCTRLLVEAFAAPEWRDRGRERICESRVIDSRRSSEKDWCFFLAPFAPLIEELVLVPPALPPAMSPTPRSSLSCSDICLEFNRRRMTLDVPREVRWDSADGCRERELPSQFLTAELPITSSLHSTEQRLQTSRPQSAHVTADLCSSPNSCPQTLQAVLVWATVAIFIFSRRFNINLTGGKINEIIYK